MKKKNNSNSSIISRMFTTIKELDYTIEKWIHHFIKQIEDHNRTNINQSE